MEIKPTYVTFEQAKKLKEKGFDVPVKGLYFDGELKVLEKVYFTYTKFNSTRYFSAPEQWQVIEWLRVKYDIHITYDIGLTGYYGLIKYRHSEGSLYLNRWVNEQENPFNSPQEATSAAIDYVLNNLI